VRDRQVLAATRGDFAPCLEDWRTLLGWNFGKHDGTQFASFDERLSAGRTNVSHPLRSIPEHRDEVALALVTGDDEDGKREASAAPALHLQCEQDFGCKAKSGYPRKDPAPNPPQAGRAPASVEEPQVSH
jgi:hypothetical protein